jgi:putative endonuclease
MAYMYILECSDGSFYTGSTKNLPRRLWQHQNGFGANHTKKRLPVMLVYAEYYDHVSDAFYREKQVQGWSRKKKIALIHSDWDKLHILAECQNDSHYKMASTGVVSAPLNHPTPLTSPDSTSDSSSAQI